MKGQNAELKQRICKKARELGANLIRSCPVERWAEYPIQRPEFWPQHIWPWVKNVIVLGIPLYVPMMAAAPSMIYQELYDTSNRILDDMAYRLTKFHHHRTGIPRAVFSTGLLLQHRGTARPAGGGVFPCAGGALCGYGDDRG